MHALDREVAARAHRSAAVDFAVHGKFNRLAAQDIIAKVMNQLGKCFHLLRMRSTPFKITHKANSNALHVNLMIPHVATLELAPPPVSYFNLAASGIKAAADNKMISETVFHSAVFAVVSIIRGRVAALDSTVVANNPSPSSTRYIEAIGH